MNPVVFVYADFIALFPEFAPLTSGQLNGYFTMAGAFFDNSTQNPAFVTGVPNMTTLMYFLTAHIAWLYAARDENGNPSASGQIAPQTVGQITSASEGSVSVGLAAIATGVNQAAAWFAQTKYGLLYWAACAQFRTFRYSARPTIVPETIFAPYPGAVVPYGYGGT